MNVRRTLDLYLLGTIDSADIVIRLSQQVNERFRDDLSLKELYDRARSAIHFFLPLNDGSEAWWVEAKIRAGLNEVYSMEDAARRAFRRSSRVAKPPKLSDSRHPLVHMMYCLRHINVHVKPTVTERRDVSIRFADAEIPQDFTFGASMLTDDMLDQVLGNKDVKELYEASEMRAALVWLLENQKAFGVGQVFKVGVERYCNEIILALDI